MDNRREHWERVHSRSGEQGVSWFEARPDTSLAMLESAGLGPGTCVVDIGGGASRLVDGLLQRGVRCVTVLDISAAAIDVARARLGEAAAVPRWVVADVTGDWTLQPMDIWHDRAVFHFLTDPGDRRRYVQHIRETVKPGGAVVMATFAPDGPERCSGLPVVRYSAEDLAAELGGEFRLLESLRHEHHTPSAHVQPFIYCRFRRQSEEAPILSRKQTDAPSVFSPITVLTEAMRQKQIRELRVPPVCVLDPDGDIVRWLQRTGRATLSETWSCYHSDLYEFELSGQKVGIVGTAVGAPYAVLLAEQLFVSGCELLISVTSAGQILNVAEPPYFVLATKALRDEGTSYHYLPIARYAEANPKLLDAARAALAGAGVPCVEGPTWTTDAPFRETAAAVSEAEQEGILAVEMETAALYAFAQARNAAVVCLAHVTNTMGRRDKEFEKGPDDGAADCLRVIEALRAIR
jgi:uridine phosphorylase/SAM-dependent methyltransferase